ncbi:hypothetical protein NIES2107_18370 [Nostoc carneum NIES-2107]|nr:hypothetical protein NIES2107_18370 [Nostoc carneum NIES-2107]
MKLQKNHSDSQKFTESEYRILSLRKYFSLAKVSEPTVPTKYQGFQGLIHIKRNYIKNQPLVRSYH